MEAIKNKSWINWQFKDLDSKGRVLLAVNAFNNEDADGDISKQGSFKKTLKENFSRIRWFLNHDLTKLLGVPVKGYESNEFLNMEAQFNLEKEIARDTYEDYKLYAEHGKTLEHSVGLQAIKYDIDEEKQIREVSEWKLWEFSTLTHWGANENTPLLGIKSMEQLKELLEKMESNKRYSDKRKQQIENTYEALIYEPPTKETDYNKLIIDF